MATSLSIRYRKLTDLFVQGRALKMPDDTYLWVQVINAYERDECVSDAQVARSRLVLALKAKGDERTKVEGRLAEVGFDDMAQDLARVRAGAKLAEFADDMREDPDWKEKMEVVLGTDWDQAAVAATDEETLFLAELNDSIIREFAKREDDEYAYQLNSFKAMSDEDFIDAWVEEWIDRKGAAIAAQEFKLTEMWFSARFCDGVASPDGTIDHSKCDGHRVRVFESKAEARSAPQELQNLIRGAIEDLNMEGRDPKDLGNGESSSASSPPPSAPGELTASTSTATPPTAPGT